MRSQKRRRLRAAAEAGPDVVTLATALTDYWSMDDTPEGAFANSVHFNPLYGGWIGVCTGVLGQGFDAVATTGEVATMTSVLVNAPEWSVSFWAQAVVPDEARPTLLWVDGELRVEVWNVAMLAGVVVTLFDPLQTPIELPVQWGFDMGPWHHLVLTKTPAEFRFYQDGMLRLTEDLSSSELSALGGPLHVGSSGLGAFDEVGVWERALSAAEVEQLCNGGAGLSYGSF
jgi:hypothetical protein